MNVCGETLKITGNSSLRMTVNGDGLVDLVLHFETQQTGIDGNDSEACLSGETTDGQQLEGCHDIHVK